MPAKALEEEVLASHRIPEPGVALDPYGGRTVDPTKNVLDLVRAESKYQDAMRDFQGKIIDEKVESLKEIVKLVSDSGLSYQNAQIAAETRRIDQLAQTRQEFQNTIRDMLAESVRTTSTLVSTQLVQIQATFDTRVSKLEAGAFTQAGKQSERDPAISDAISRMTLNLSSLKANTEEMIAKIAAANIESIAKLTATLAQVGTSEQKSQSEKMGQGQVIAWIIGAAMLMAAIATPLIAFLALRTH